MLLEIDHHSGQPIYRQIIAQIRSQIISGRLPVGQQLMSVRDLARQLKVNPMTISKAYAFLETESLVQRRRGVGLFVAEVRQSQKEQTKMKILEELLRKAAVTAAQLDISPEESSQMFDKLCQQYNGKMRRQK